MSTLRVDIQYRPIRIGWVIRSTDIVALRTAARLSYALWGGTFNPILFSDRPSEARAIARVFRIDTLIHIPTGDTANVLEMPYLRGPLSPFETLFDPNSEHANPAAFLDIENALESLLQVRRTQGTLPSPVIAQWDTNDPLADTFLMDFGGYPPSEDCGFEYERLLIDKLGATRLTIGSGEPIPVRASGPAVSAVAGFGLQYDWPVGIGWPSPGIFVGYAENVEDLACYWNARALGAAVFFVDPRHYTRYSEVLLPRVKRARKAIAHWHERSRHIARWIRVRRDDEPTFPESFQELDQFDRSDQAEQWQQPVTPLSWNGLNFKSPTTYIHSTSTLGVLYQDTEPRLSFSFPDKPFATDPWFANQRLVASVQIHDRLKRDSQHTFSPVYLPELNETYGREMTGLRDRIRAEPGRLAILIRPSDSDYELAGFSTMTMMQETLRLAGYDSRLSTGGKIARQLISTLGGLQGARPFKIPGVRRLFGSQGPSDYLVAQDAIDLIAAKDHKTKPFGPHVDLRIEPRDSAYKLSPRDVFEYLVGKGLFLTGVKLQCPHCLLPSWIPIESIKHEAVCTLCGNKHDARRQLAGSKFYYRKSSLLGFERNCQGAMPVALTLQQLDVHLRDFSSSTRSFYSLSTELTKASSPSPSTTDAEIDFLWLIQRCYDPRILLILGECKDKGPIPIENFKVEMNKLRELADSIPNEPFETFILFAKLGAFTDEEIAHARTCNEEHRLRVILLSDEELDPYDIFDGMETRQLISTPEGLAEATARKYLTRR